MAPEAQLSFSKSYGEFNKLHALTEDLKTENISEAVAIISKALTTFGKSDPDVKKSAISRLISDIEKEKFPNIQAHFGQARAGEDYIFSVKLVAGNKGETPSRKDEYIITLQVEQHRTQLSLMKNGKIAELLSEENKQLLYQHQK